MTSRLTVMAVAVGCVLAGIASPVGADEFLLAGDSQGLWLVRLSPQGGTFDVLAKPSATRWRWIKRDLLGSPAAVAAIDESLHVLLARPKGYLVFPLSGGDGMPGLNPVDKRWPAKAVPVAACAAESFAGAEGKSVVVVVPRRANLAERRQAASRSATAPAGAITLGVFQNVEGKWGHVGDVPGRAGDHGVLTAVRDGRLYVLMRPAGRNRLATWRDGRWSDVPLSGSTADSDVFGMVVIGGKLLLVTSSGQSNSRRLQIVELDDSGKELSVQPIVREGKAAPWQQEAAPLIARLADQVALVWRDGDAMKFATCDLAGQLGPTGEIAILARPTSDGKGDKFLEYFLWALVCVTMASTLLLRPHAPLGQFKLPETLGPAPLGKRLLAGILDLVPFAMIGSVVLVQGAWPMVSPLDKSTAVMWETLEKMDSGIAYTIMATAVAYLGYCVLMELRYGATAGKMLLGLRVVGDGGVRPRLREVLLRNLVKVMILLSPVLAPLMLVVLLNRNRQRLGDMMGRTVVVDIHRVMPSGPGSQESHDDDAQET